MILTINSGVVSDSILAQDHAPLCGMQAEQCGPRDRFLSEPVPLQSLKSASHTQELTLPFGQDEQIYQGSMMQGGLGEYGGTSIGSNIYDGPPSGGYPPNNPKITFDFMSISAPEFVPSGIENSSYSLSQSNNLAYQVNASP